MLAPLPLVFRVIAEVDKRVVPLRRLHDHITATPAIATRGPAARHKFLATEGHAAVSTVAGLHPDFGFINEHK
jgi:hypothetical protein